MVLEALPPIHLLFCTDENEAARLLDQEREVRRGLQKALEDAFLKRNDLKIELEREVDEHTCTMEMLEELEEKLAGMQENAALGPEQTDRKEKTHSLLRKERESKLELQRELESERENTTRAREETERVQSELAAAKQKVRDCKLRLEIFKRDTHQPTQKSENGKNPVSPIIEVEETENKANMKSLEARDGEVKFGNERDLKELMVWRERAERMEANVSMLLMLVTCLMAIIAAMVVAR
eukprot:comp17984_c0_seq1/m.18383 comp17984_c0_seq1/g.18383  ORF comp17984_c0_seq1/g.18383 comp17984_c0_seq1/m.18383 type:complete len:239 (-) comp17984_c0_seq1:365-1081(-)